MNLTLKWKTHYKAGRAIERLYANDLIMLGQVYWSFITAEHYGAEYLGTAMLPGLSTPNHRLATTEEAKAWVEAQVTAWFKLFE